AKTKGYHCTVLNLMLLALAVAGQQQRLDGEQRRSLLLRMEKTGARTQFSGDTATLLVENGRSSTLWPQVVSVIQAKNYPIEKRD
ncbi:outer membrane protein assembly factor BamC, partial [Salmonella enterica subsp. enterica serovar Anatum]|nr:outer membrane protein assembly factor BamC [Salmonella enterica subsp. enterica serovar Anatum]